MDFKTGGKKVIERLVEAYGFKTRQALCDHLGVSKSTLATRYMRDIFPAEWVLQCALETKTPLEWLVSGVGLPNENFQTDLIKVPKKKLIEGALYDANFYFFDKALIPTNIKDPIAILDGQTVLVAESSFSDIVDGKWLIEIDGKKSIRNIIRIPGGKVKVGTGDTSFDCLINDIIFNFKIELIISKEGVNL